MVFSCQTNTEDFKGKENEDAIIITSGNFKSIGDGIYDALGYGYDCTYTKIKGSEYVSEEPIIDIQRYITGKGKDPITGNSVIVDTGRVNIALIHGGGDTDQTWGFNLEDYKKNINNQTSISATIKSDSIKLFSAELKNYFKEDYRFSQVYSFYRMDATKTTRKISFSKKSPVAFKYALSDAFISDLKGLTADEVVRKYGTHVLTDIRLGGIGSIIYNARLANTTSAEQFKNQANIFFNVISASSDYSKTDSMFIEYRDVNIKIMALGGSKTINSDVKIDATTSKLQGITFNYTDWINSVNATTEQVIGIGHHNTIIYPISEFVFDTNKKTEIELAIKRYCAANLLLMKQIETIENRGVMVYNPRSYTIPGSRSTFHKQLSSEGSIGKQYLKIIDGIGRSMATTITFIPDGKYYRIANSNNYYLESDKRFKPLSSSSSQLWYIEFVSQDLFKIRNLATNYYLGIDVNINYPNSTNQDILWKIANFRRSGR